MLINLNGNRGKNCEAIARSLPSAFRVGTPNFFCKFYVSHLQHQTTCATFVASMKRNAFNGRHLSNEH